MSSSRTLRPTPLKWQGLCHPSPNWSRGTVHKDTLHAVFTWLQRPFLVLCVWKLAFKVATRRHLQPHSPQPISGSSTFLLPPLLQTCQDLVIYTFDIYRKFPCLSLYFLPSSFHNETSFNLNNIIQAGVFPVFNWNIFHKWADPVKKKKIWSKSVNLIYSALCYFSLKHMLILSIMGPPLKLLENCSQFVAHCLARAEIESERSTLARVANCPVTITTCDCQRSDCIPHIFVFSITKFLHPPVPTSLSIWLVMEHSTPVMLH